MERKEGKRRGSAGGSKRRGRRESRTTTHGWHVDEGERLKDDLSQCGVTRDQQRERTLNSAQMCSLIHVTHVVLCVLVLVGVRLVTVVIVHIGHEEVLVVIQFCVAIFVVIFCIRRCSLYTPRR